MKTKKMLKKYLPDERGSALISAFIVISMLLILGIGVLTLSMANVQQTKVDDTFERDYYAADGGAKQGVEALEAAALEQYGKIAADLKNNVQSSNTASSFFSALDAVTYAPPQPDSSSGGPSQLSVTISHTAVDADTHRYSVLSAATDGKTSRRIMGSIDISFVPVTQTGGFAPLGGQVMIAGPKIYSRQSTVVINGDSIAQSYDIDYPTNFQVSGTKQTGSAAMSWNSQYSDHYEAKTSVTPSIPAVSNGATVSSGSFSGGVPSPLYLEGVSGASYTVSGISAQGGGQIYSSGALTVSNGNYGGTSSSNWLKLYSTGNMTINSCTLAYVKIFCGGALTISSCGMPDNMVIVCAGNVNVSSASLADTKLFCGGAFSFTSNSITGNSIIYSRGNITFSNASGTMHGLFYSGGVITISQASMQLTGQIAAQGEIDITQASPSYTYDAALIQQLESDPFVTGGSGAAVIVQPPDSQIFTGTPSYTEQ